MVVKVIYPETVGQGVTEEEGAGGSSLIGDPGLVIAVDPEADLETDIEAAVDKS